MTKAILKSLIKGPKTSEKNRVFFKILLKKLKIRYALRYALTPVKKMGVKNEQKPFVNLNPKKSPYVEDNIKRQYKTERDQITTP